MTAYRYPNERLILALTLLLALTIIAITAAATVCASGLFVVLVILLAYSSSRSHHQQLLRHAYPVTTERAPQLAPLIQATVNRLRPGPVQIFITPNRQLNAYTFGLSEKKVIVLYSALFEVMDADELRFIIGHEMGHIALGHTWLNSLVGGIAGIPSSSGSSMVLHLALLGWSRACEYSADRAGLLACGNPEKAVAALVKLVAGPAGLTHAGMEYAYRQIDAEDDTLMGSLNEALGSHPMLIRRINQLRDYARSEQYRRLLAQMERRAPLANAAPDDPHPTA